MASDMEVFELNQRITYLEAKLAEAQAKLAETRTYSYETVNGLVKWRDNKIAVLENAIRWALGEIDDFPERKNGQGGYWWRTELRERARSARRRSERV